MSYEDCILLSVDIHLKKRKKRSPTLPSSSAKSGSGSIGRPISNPYWEFFIGNADNLISVVKTMNNHGKICGGEIYFRRAEVTTKRFVLTFKCSCSLEKLCRKWQNGIYRLQSTNDIRTHNSPTRSFPIPDVLYALGVSMTPNTMTHSDQLFSAMMLNPPSRNLLKDIIKIVVDPYLVNKKNDIISVTCDDLRSLSNLTVLCMDVGHSSARNSQAATLAAARGNLLLFTLTDTHTNAWLKESSLVSRALEYAVNEKQLDISTVEVDDNSKNALLVSSFKRINGPIGMRDEPIKVAIDVFHAAKSLGRNTLKISKEHLTILEKTLQPLCNKNIDVPFLLQDLISKLIQKSEEYFDEIT